MKAIVTGAAGFIGNRLCSTILGKGWNVLGISRRPMPPSLEACSGLRWLRCDLARENVDVAAVGPADVLFHVAGATAGARGDERFYLDANERTAFNVFNAFAGRVDRIVHASSQAVYGDPRSLAVDETFPLQAGATPYACSKVHSENWLWRFRAARGGHAVALRLCGFLEGGGAVDFFRERAERNEPIEVLGMGRVYRDYLALDDGVTAFVSASSAVYARPTAAAYNIGSGDRISWLDLASLIRGLLGSTSELRPVDTPAPTGDLVLEIGLARAQLGFAPPPLREAVTRYVRSKRLLHA